MILGGHYGTSMTWVCTMPSSQTQLSQLCPFRTSLDGTVPTNASATFSEIMHPNLSPRSLSKLTKLRITPGPCLRSLPGNLLTNLNIPVRVNLDRRSSF